MNITDVIIDPKYEKMVPATSEEDFESLKESIKKNGLFYPIVLNEKHVLLDGHRRFKACDIVKVPKRFVIKKFENKLLEEKFVIESNLNRRHLTQFQKVELAIPLIKIESELAKQRQLQGKTLASNEAKGKASEIVGNRYGLSKSTLERAKKIIEVGPEKVKEALRVGGKTTINKEYQRIIKAEKKQKRQEEMKKVQVQLPESVTLKNIPFQDMDLKPNSVDLIFTDPPYHEKFLYLYKDLAKQAAKVLKPGGSLLTYIGHYATIKIGNMMESEGLKFHWPLVVQHSGPSASVFGYKVLVSYKPILWFTKGKYEGEFVRDTIKSEFQGKELHEWAQSTVESDYYIKYMTQEGDVVYDPFLGQGTFGVSAVKLKRQFIGTEINKEYFLNAQKLISLAAKK